MTRPAASRRVDRVRPHLGAPGNAPKPGRTTSGRRVPRPILIALAWLAAFGLAGLDVAPAVDAARSDTDGPTTLAASRTTLVGEFARPAVGAAVDRAGPGHRAPTRDLPGIVAPSPEERATSGPTVAGIASTYGPGWDGWIAWPSGPGWRMRVCGPGGCIVVVTTDAGPDLAMQRAGRVVDLDVPTFELVAGADWTIGLTKVSVTVLGRARGANARR